MQQRPFDEAVTECRTRAWRQNEIDVRSFVIGINTRADEEQPKALELGRLSEFAKRMPRSASVIRPTCFARAPNKR